MAFYLALLGHLLYDFHWQGAFVAEWKAKNNFILSVHALTWALITALPFYVVGDAPYWLAGFLFATRLVVDAWKSRCIPKDDSHFWAIYVDQGIHFATLVVAAIASQ